MPASSTQPGPATESPLAGAVRGLTIDPARLRAHVMRPAHIQGVTSDHGLEDEGIHVPLTLFPPQPAPRPRRSKPQHLDVAAFVDALHAALKDKVTGYIMRLQKDGTIIQTLEWKWAQTPADGSLHWVSSRPMHVASVSKLITAMAVVRLLADHHISLDAGIAGHLPLYWKKGQNVDRITFRNLLTHTSGFAADTRTDFETMKEAVALGVLSPDAPMTPRLGSSHYENMNFGLCRILIATINGNVDKNALLPDSAWDLVTILAYTMYVAAKVFGPAGVSGATLARPAKCALAYTFPPTGSGWDSGDLETVSGGVGWHLSVNELLRVMSAFRRQGTILPAKKAQEVLNGGLGIDQVLDTPAGRLYNKNGGWHSGGRTEQSLAYFLPENMEMVLLANSDVGLPAASFRKTVTDVYLGHLK